MRSRPPAVASGQQVFRKECVQIADRVAVETDVARVLSEQLDRRLVIEDHLRLVGRFALGRLARFEEPLGFEQRVGVALEPARIPREIDEQPIHHLPQMRAGGQRLARGAAEGGEFFPQRRGKIRGHVGPVTVEKRKYIAHRLALGERPVDEFFSLFGGARQADGIELGGRFGDGPRSRLARRRCCGRERRGETRCLIAPAGASAESGEPAFGHELGEPALQRPTCK